MKLLALILILQSLEVVLGSWYSLATTEYFVNASGNIVTSYQAAVEACALMNATLARVKTEQVHGFLVGKISNVTSEPYSFYIGLKRSNVSTTGFQWNDGANETANNKLWLSGEPNNNNGLEDCVQMGLRQRKEASYKWNDVSCNYALGRYICQRSRATTPTVSKSSAPYYVIAIVGIIFVAAAGCALFYFKQKGNSASEKQVTNDDAVVVDNVIYNGYNNTVESPVNTVTDMHGHSAVYSEIH